MDQATFRQELEMALASLRDVVRLRTSELAGLLVPEASHAQRGWELSAYLLRAVNELRPAADEPDEWAQRRYRLLTLRYVNGLSPDDVADRLAISRRHFYRQLKRALDEFADSLWASCPACAKAKPGELPSPVEGVPSSEYLELLRQESAALLQKSQSSSLPAVLQSVLGVLAGLLHRRQVRVFHAIPSEFPEIPLSPEILKQLLLGLFGKLLKDERTQAITLSAQMSAQGGELTITAHRNPSPIGAPSDVEEDLYSASTALALLQDVKIELAESRPDQLVYRVTLPGLSNRVVLVVDDNEDVCLLLRRYLVSGGYQPLVATDAAKALRLARSQELYAITLDLMMNNEDGWDILQALTHDPHTAHVPIVVCSVLDEEELAQMLGATAFIRKPVLCEPLLKTLAELKPRVLRQAVEPATDDRPTG